jgi:hypothetical protein
MLPPSLSAIISASQAYPKDEVGGACSMNGSEKECI